MTRPLHTRALFRSAAEAALATLAALSLATVDAATAGAVDVAVGTAAACAATTPPSEVRFEAPPRWVESDKLPAHCEIRGIAVNKIRFVMKLPANWQGRFLLAGCGGFCGELQPDREGYGNTINYAVRRGYAAISHDGGHQAPSWETDWARDPEALEIWAHKVLPIMVEAGTALARSVYGGPPRYKYFAGCSNGGRLGMMAAQRYPNLFDGVAAGASIFDLGGTAGLWGSWSTMHAFPSGRPLLSTDDWKALHEYVLQRCDAHDGRRDRRIDKPAECSIDFRDAAGEKGFLTNVQAEALNALYGGVRDGTDLPNSGGAPVYPALEYGAEFFGDIWLGGTAEQPGWGIRASKGYRELLAASLGETPPASPTIEVTKSLIARSKVSALTDATDTDLRPLAKAGGKLLIYQGLADPLIIPQPIETYYAAAATKIGGLARLREHARLFMVPGWGHCWERPTATGDDFDPLAALEAWVERGAAPETLKLRSRDGRSEEDIRMR